MIPSTWPRARLAHLPTPIEALPRLSRHLGGPLLYVKRDDLTGLATGGNKARKLELLLGDAVARGADTLITSGAAQSNQARQCAAAAARLGLGCELVLVRPRQGGGPQGNLLLDGLLGATVRWVLDKDEMAAAVEQLAGELRDSGRSPYVVPYGASNGLGAASYVEAMAEIVAAGRFDRVVVASSSGGTQAGLALGARLMADAPGVLGISVDVEATQLRATVARFANEAAELLGATERLTAGEIEVNDEFLGGGYGVVGELEREAISLAASLEGLVLDPVYTGRAFGGLVELIRAGHFGGDERVLFVHTGGTPAVFAYAAELST